MIASCHITAEKVKQGVKWMKFCSWSQQQKEQADRKKRRGNRKTTADDSTMTEQRAGPEVQVEGGAETPVRGGNTRKQGRNRDEGSANDKDAVQVWRQSRLSEELR